MLHVLCYIFNDMLHVTDSMASYMCYRFSDTLHVTYVTGSVTCYMCCVTCVTGSATRYTCVSVRSAVTDSWSQRSRV